MTAYTVDRAKHATLAANTVDTVTLARARNVEVVNKGAVDIFFKLGSAPTVLGDNTFVATAGGSFKVPASDYSYGSAEPAAAFGLVVQLIASAPCAYSVTAV